MGKLSGALECIQRRVDGFFYTCEYIKECNMVTPQCRDGGNNYCGEYLKRINTKRL
ncbi:MAG: hypothetical protein NWE93_10610 [Candidatus Bathyarchaeota archaeon]|nr:hypothetical protein [Candidatus Bathyarchaeota archaeon]